MYPSICFSIHLSIHPSIHESIHPSIAYPPVHAGHDQSITYKLKNPMNLQDIRPRDAY